MNTKPSILYLTDFYYPAKGRKYHEEDLYIISELRNDFKIIICHPKDSKNHEEHVDLVIIRNTGSIMYFKEYFEEFVERVTIKSILTYNEMSGKGDMQGKQHLLELTNQKYPVIPTIDSILDIKILPPSDKYLLKLKDGADSIGMKTATYEELLNLNTQDYIIQPFVDFIHEVSFYYIDFEFQYALYAPNKTKRWDLEEYIPTKKDLVFANKFIEWNSINHGIQRVDACLQKNGELVLVELEDLNPYLSLDALTNSIRKQFIASFKTSLLKLLNTKLITHEL